MRYIRQCNTIYLSCCVYLLSMRARCLSYPARAARPAHLVVPLCPVLARSVLYRSVPHHPRRSHARSEPSAFPATPHRASLVTPYHVLSRPARRLRLSCQSPVSPCPVLRQRHTRDDVRARRDERHDRRRFDASREGRHPPAVLVPSADRRRLNKCET